jgi:hypothetical protein
MYTKFWSEILKESDYWEKKYEWMEGCVITDLTYVRCTDLIHLAVDRG